MRRVPKRRTEPRCTRPPCRHLGGPGHGQGTRRMRVSSCAVRSRRRRAGGNRTRSIHSPRQLREPALKQGDARSPPPNEFLGPETVYVEAPLRQQRPSPLARTNRRGIGAPSHRSRHARRAPGQLGPVHPRAKALSRRRRGSHRRNTLHVRQPTPDRRRGPGARQPIP